MSELAPGTLVRHTRTNDLALVLGREPYGGLRLVYLNRFDSIVEGDPAWLRVAAGPDEVRAVLRYLGDDLDV